jgi:hypothetical protein
VKKEEGNLDKRRFDAVVSVSSHRPVQVWTMHSIVGRLKSGRTWMYVGLIFYLKFMAAKKNSKLLFKVDESIFSSLQ